MRSKPVFFRVRRIASLLIVYYTTLVGYMFICLGHFVLLKKCVAMERLRISDLFDMRVVTVISMLLMGFTISCGLMYQWKTLRWIVIAVLSIVMVFTRNRWIGFIRYIKGDKENG